MGVRVRQIHPHKADYRTYQADGGIYFEGDNPDMTKTACAG